MTQESLQLGAPIMASVLREPTSWLQKASQLVWTDGFYPVEINEFL